MCGYKPKIISTIVDGAEVAAHLAGYKPKIISTIVDYLEDEF